MPTEAIILTSNDLTVSVSPFGAEMIGWRHKRFGELLWSGDAKWWDRQSPLLFPVTGRSIGGQVRIAGQYYPMPLHGFAHSMMFEIVDVQPAEVRLSLSENAISHGHYPFPFRLDVTYRLDGPDLAIEAQVTNTGDGPLPASFGFHPGFVWPLPGASSRNAHSIELDGDTHLDVLRADGGGFMLPQAETIALTERKMALRDELFDAGTMIMRAPASRAVRYQASDADCAIRLSWSGLSRLLFWTKPGAPFVCIEPWAGEPDPAGFAGEFADRPGIDIIAPGAQRLYALTIAVEPT